MLFYPRPTCLVRVCSAWYRRAYVKSSETFHFDGFKRGSNVVSYGTSSKVVLCRRRKSWKPTHFQSLLANGHYRNCPVLFSVCGREDGETCYCAIPLQESPSARNPLAACKDISTAYARMALLRTLSRFVLLPPKLQSFVEEDILYGDWEVTDGQCECSLEVAKALGLVGESREVYEAWQLRGVLPLPNFSSCLMKGMLVVDPTLETGLRLRKGCIKVVWPPGTLARNAVMIGETPAAFVSQPFCVRSVVAQPSSAAANMLSKHGIAKSGNCKDLPACLSQGSVIYPRVCCLLRS